MDEAELARIRSNAALAIEQLGPLSGLAFGYDRQSVVWAEGFIERQRARAPSEGFGAMASVLGCFLGEAIIAAAGGGWARSDEHGLGVRFDNDDWCFPLAKVEKQFADGVARGESIVSFFDVSMQLAARGPQR